MSGRNIQIFISFARAQSTPVVTIPGDLVRPVQNYLVNLNYDEEQEEFFLERLKLDKTTDTCDIEIHYLQHLIEFLQGVPHGYGY